MERIHAGIAPIASHKGKDVWCSSAIECDGTLYEDKTTLILSFYNRPLWFGIKGEIVAVYEGSTYYYTDKDGKRREGRDTWDLYVWAQDDECECGNEDTRNEQDEKGLPMDEPVCAWHSYEFDYKSVEYVVTVP